MLAVDKQSFENGGFLDCCYGCSRRYLSFHPVPWGLLERPWIIILEARGIILRRTRVAWLQSKAYARNAKCGFYDGKNRVSNEVTSMDFSCQADVPRCKKVVNKGVLKSIGYREVSKLNDPVEKFRTFLRNVDVRRVQTHTSLSLSLLVKVNFF